MTSKKINKKKTITCLLLVSFSLAAAAQTTEANKPLAQSVEILVGGTFGKPKIMPNLDKLGIAQLSVNFKQVSSKSVTEREKKMSMFGKQQGKAATATVTAYLNITDEEITDADYQQLTDQFYKYFQQALKKNNVDTISWSAVVNTDLYKDGKANNENEKDQGKGETWVTYTANTGNTIFNGSNYFAFGKIKKAERFCKETGAPAAFINTTVDFADILVDVDVKTTGYQSTWTPSYNTIGQTTKMKSNTSVAAFMKIPAYGGTSLLWNEKNHAETINIVKDIAAEMNYADGLTEDPSLLKKKSKLFSVSFSKKMESAPVVISATRAQYLAAAGKALERYADAFIAKAKDVKKS